MDANSGTGHSGRQDCGSNRACVIGAVRGIPIAFSIGALDPYSCNSGRGVSNSASRGGFVIGAVRGISIAFSIRSLDRTYR